MTGVLPIPKACRRCRRKWTQQRRHHTRGLCGPCYPGVRARGELGNYRLLRPGNDLAAIAEEWDSLRPYGVTQGEFAKRLGLHQSTVSKLLTRARAAAAPADPVTAAAGAAR